MNTNFVMFKLIDLFFFLMLIISTSISLFIFRLNVVSRKSFHKIYSIISNPEIKHNEKINLIGSLHDYLNGYSEEQISFDNLVFFKKDSVFWYDSFFVGSFALVVFLALGSNLPDAAKVFLIFFTNTIIRLLILNIFYFLLCRKVEICYVKRNSLVYTVTNLAKENILIITTSLILFSIFTGFFILLQETLRNGESTIQFFNIMISEISASDIESMSGIRFSLSGLFFTLAISGTVVFSIMSSHLKHKEKINEELNKQINIFSNWYRENEKSLLIKFEDIFNKSVVMDFYKAVDALYMIFGVKDFKTLKTPIRRFYSLFYSLIVL